MAVTIAIVKHNVEGQEFTTIADVTGPASYTTGGETLTLAQQQQVMGGQAPPAMDWTRIFTFVSEVNAGIVGLALDKANGKMLMTVNGAQAAGASNQSAVTVRCRFSYGYPSV